MTEGKFNIQIGSVDRTTFTIGDYATVQTQNGLTAAEVADLRSVFDGLRAEVTANAPPDQREEALAQAAEVEASVVAGQLDPGRFKRALAWFRANAPGIAGTVASVVVSPIVGKVVEGAGDAIASRFREAVDAPPH
jgi:hypothetical protein